MSETTPQDTKRAKVTDEHRQESARLLSIWNRMKPALAVRGYGTQETFGQTFGIGNQASVSHFLNGRSAISLQAAIAFARGLECRIADFSPRLAAAAGDIGGPTSVAPAPVDPVQTDLAFQEAASPAGAEAINVREAVEHLARVLQAMPERQREGLASQLMLLATVPDSATLVRRLASALLPFDAPSPRSPRRQTAGGVLAARLDGISDPTRQAQLFALLDGVLDRALRPVDSFPESTPSGSTAPVAPSQLERSTSAPSPSRPRLRNR